MELATSQSSGSEPETGEHFIGPLENPVVRQQPGDPLLEPHPDEPGVNGDGGAPLENPGRARS